MGLGGKLLIGALGLVLAGCGDPRAQTGPALDRRSQDLQVPERSIFELLRDRNAPAREVVGVNRYIWRAALDTLSFLPLQAVDPFSGVIVTDWGQVAGGGAPYRVTVYVTEPALDARALKVAAFRQQGGRAVPVAESDNRRLEDAILTRARQLRIAAAARG
jgi:hypothetical protein